MYASFLDHLWQSILQASWLSIVLWLGLAALTISLVTLMLTQWGHSEPLKKCVVLSLLAHLLLGIYAMSVRIVSYHPGASIGQGVHATLWDEGPVPWEPLPPESSSSEQPPPTEVTADTLNKSPTLLEPTAANPPSSPLLLAAPNAPLLTPEWIKSAVAEAPRTPPVSEVAPPALPVETTTISEQGANSATAAMTTPLIAPEASDNKPNKVPAQSVATTNHSSTPVVAATLTGTPTPAIYRDRLAANRQELLLSRGGSPETEDAVQRALHWLALAQSADGRWDADRYGAGQERLVLGHDRNSAGAKADTAVTGLALLAMLGAGHTHLDNREYSSTVRKGLEFLLAAQARDGSLAGQAELFAAMYSHGMATLALGEAYALTRDQRLEPALRAALDYTVRAQHSQSGSWRYQMNESGDMSQLGWQLMALKSGEIGGLPIPTATQEGMVRFVKSASSGQHGGIAAYRYNERPSRTMTAEALVARQFLGMTRDNPAGWEAAEYLLGELPTEQRVNLYYWYYATLGLYQQGGEPWQKWNTALQPVLLKRQIAVGNITGSWNPDCIWGGYGGRVYSTAMAALCLQVYYRYLPLYQHEQRVADRVVIPPTTR